MSYRVAGNHHLHAARGHLCPGDTIPENWLDDEAQAAFLAAGSIEEIEESPAAPAAPSNAEPDTGIELVERKRRR